MNAQPRIHKYRIRIIHKYRIRMRQLKWYVEYYSVDSKYVGENGPYIDIRDAINKAKESGAKDWDEG